MADAAEEAVIDDYPAWVQAVDERGRPLPVEAQDRPWRPGVDPQAEGLLEPPAASPLVAIARAAAQALAREAADVSGEAVPPESSEREAVPMFRPAPHGSDRGPWPKRPMPASPVSPVQVQAVPPEDAGDLHAAVRRAAIAFGLQPLPAVAPQAAPPRGCVVPILPVPTAAREPRHVLARALSRSQASPAVASLEAVPVEASPGRGGADALPDASDDEAELLAAAHAMERRARLPLAVAHPDAPIHPVLRETPATESPRPPEWVLRVFQARDPAAAVFALLGPEARVAASCLQPRIRDACLVAAALDAPRWQCPSQAFLPIAHAAWGAQHGIELARLCPGGGTSLRP